MSPKRVPPWRSEDYETSEEYGAKRQRVTSGDGHAEVEDEWGAVDDVRLDGDPWSKDPSGRRCAFVVTLFGHHPGYCLEAAVLGQSLQRT